MRKKLVMTSLSVPPPPPPTSAYIRPSVRPSDPLGKPLWNVTLNLCGNPRFFDGKWDGLLLLEKQTRILKNTNFFVFVEYVVKLHMSRKQATNKQIWNPRATNKQVKCQLKTNMWWAGWVIASHAVVFRRLVLLPPHKRLLTQTPHSFTIVLLPKHPSQSPSSHCLMISNQIAGYNGRFRFPQALYSLWYSLERWGS